ncbi:3-carboxy-cis,cis-muconate cycloisomerase [Rhodobacteraceae bacterium NNCM2]|nr:3-carboxy-cis,cis-muconate cycloisomerase [Coraliihabitans acroporae]
MSFTLINGPLLSRIVGDEEIAAHFSDEAEIAGICAFEAALAEASAAHGLIPEAAAQRIAALCRTEGAGQGDYAEGLARDGLVVPSLVRRLREQLDEDDGPLLHKGSTSQDAIDTSLALRIRAVSGILAGRLERLQGALYALTAQVEGMRWMARTRMQVALEIPATVRIAGWERPLAALMTQLPAARDRLCRVQLAGPVGTAAELGPEAGAIARHMAAALGLTPPEGSWQTDRDALVAYGDWLSRLTGALGKIGQDVALMTQNERSEMRLRGGGTSSAMAHKNNPVKAEVLVALARYNAAQIGGLHIVLVHEQERSGTAWTLEWMLLPQMCITAGAALRNALELVESLTPVE